MMSGGLRHDRHESIISPDIGTRAADLQKESVSRVCVA